MALGAAILTASLDAVAAREPAFAAALARHGYPAPRPRAPGHLALLRTIVGQQVSVQAASAVWRRLEAALGADLAPRTLAAAPEDVLRAAGLSRQKIAYARSLGALVASGAIDLAALPADDEAAIAELVRIKGVGRWSAEIYLLFAEGRGDVWPAGDLAVQEEIGQLLGLAARPPEPIVRALAEAWRPHRGAVAILAWHHYGHRIAAARAGAAGAAAKLPL